MEQRRLVGNKICSDRAKENADKKAQELQGKTQSGIDETIRKLDLELRTRKAKGESEAKLEAERAQRTKKIISDAKSEYDAKTKGALQESNELWHLQKRLKAADEAYKKSTSNIFASGKEQKKARIINSMQRFNLLQKKLERWE